jgi:ParB family transcriptional regulator, chromosome partitioning protein
METTWDTRERPAPYPKADDTAQVRQIPLAQITFNPYQPRRLDDEAALNELVESVKQYGILQPVLVRPLGPEQYELIAGERRCLAAERAGLETVPALIKEMDDKTQAEVALIENLQREDLSPVETALAFRTLLKEFHLTQEDLAKRVGKSRSTITHALRLLQLSDTILDSLNRNEIQEGHALALLHMEDEELRELLFQEVIEEKLTQKEIRQRVREELGESTESTLKRSEDESKARRAHLAQMTEAALSAQLKQKFSRQVVIQCTHGEDGQVAMCFRNPEDMIALVDTLLAVPV